MNQRVIMIATATIMSLIPTVIMMVFLMVKIQLLMAGHQGTGYSLVVCITGLISIKNCQSVMEMDLISGWVSILILIGVLKEKLVAHPLRILLKKVERCIILT